MREDRRNYSLPTLHECAFEYEVEKGEAASPKPETTGSTPVLFEEMRYFRNKVGSRSGLIGRRHSYTAIQFRKDFNGRVRSHTYDPQVSLCHGSVRFMEDSTLLIHSSYYKLIFCMGAIFESVLSFSYQSYDNKVHLFLELL